MVVLSLLQLFWPKVPGRKQTRVNGRESKQSLLACPIVAYVAPKNDSDSTMEPRFLTLDDVAKYLSVSVPQVYALARSGDLPAIKIGGRGVWRVDRLALDKYLEKLMAETQEWAKSHPLNPRDKTELAGEDT